MNPPITYAPHVRAHTQTLIATFGHGEAARALCRDRFAALVVISHRPPTLLDAGRPVACALFSLN